MRLRRGTVVERAGARGSRAEGGGGGEAAAQWVPIREARARGEGGAAGVQRRRAWAGAGMAMGGRDAGGAALPFCTASSFVICRTRARGQVAFSVNADLR